MDHRRLVAWTLACSLASARALAQPVPTTTTPTTTTQPTTTTPTPTTTTPPATTAGPPATPPQSSIRLRDVTAMVETLTHDINAAHERLSVVAASVVEGANGGGRLVIDHDNQMGSQYLLVRLSYALDGSPVVDRSDEGGNLSGARTIPIFDGAVGAGHHTLTVKLEYQGNGYGIFAYVSGYHFHIQSNLAFTIEPGHGLHVRVTGYERTGQQYAPEERPQVRFDQEPAALGNTAPQPAPQPTAPPATAAPGGQ